MRNKTEHLSTDVIIKHRKATPCIVFVVKLTDRSTEKNTFQHLTQLWYNNNDKRSRDFPQMRNTVTFNKYTGTTMSVLCFWFNHVLKSIMYEKE